jgi:hypothetical protein
MKQLVFAMAGFATMLFAGNLHAQNIQGGADKTPATTKPQTMAKSHAGMQKHEKMKTQGNDVKLQRSGSMAKGSMVKPKEKPRTTKPAPKKTGK